MLKIGNDNEDVGTDKDKIRYQCRITVSVYGKTVSEMENGEMD